MLGGNHLYDCSYCEKNPYYFGVLGHDGPPQGMWTENLITNAPLTLCPRRTLLLARPETLREIEMQRDEVHPIWKRGMLLHSGSVGDQPAREIAYMREFDLMQALQQKKYDEIKSAEEMEGRPE